MFDTTRDHDDLGSEHQKRPEFRTCRICMEAWWTAERLFSLPSLSISGEWHVKARVGHPFPVYQVEATPDGKVRVWIREAETDRMRVAHEWEARP